MAETPTLTLAMLEKAAAAFAPILPTEVRWEFQRSRYLPPDMVYVMRPESVHANPPYVVTSAKDLTPEQCAFAVARFLEEAARHGASLPPGGPQHG